MDCDCEHIALSFFCIFLQRIFLLLIRRFKINMYATTNCASTWFEIGVLVFATSWLLFSWLVRVRITSPLNVQSSFQLLQNNRFNCHRLIQAKLRPLGSACPRLLLVVISWRSLECRQDLDWQLWLSMERFHHSKPCLKVCYWHYCWKAFVTSLYACWRLEGS